MIIIQLRCYDMEIVAGRGMRCFGDFLGSNGGDLRDQKHLFLLFSLFQLSLV